MSASIRLTKDNHRGPSLLKIVGGRRTDSTESQSRKAAVEQRKSLSTPETPMNSNAGLSDDSEDESRNDIKSSKFRKGSGIAAKKKEQKIIPPRGISGRTRTAVKGNGSATSSTSSTGKRALDEEDEEENVPSALSSQSQPGSQHSLFASSQEQRKTNATYSTKRQKGHGSSQTKANSSAEKRESKEGFRNPLPTASSTPNAPPEVKRTLKTHPTYDSPEKPKAAEKRPTFYNIDFDSPERQENHERLGFKFVQPVEISPIKNSEVIEKEDARLSDYDDDGDSDLSDIFGESKESKRIERILEERQKNEVPKAPAAKFKFIDIPEFTGGRTFQELGLTQVDLDMADQDSAIELPDHLIRCPMCREPVEKTFLEQFSCGERLTVAAQTRFCHSHKTKSAKEDWTSRGYPTIDWDTLNSRINRHHQYLRSLLILGATSHYHEQMTKTLKSLPKNNRSLKSIIHNGGSLTPGYYGTRGLRVMSENIMDKFTPQLRKLSAKDDLMFAQGVSSFVQTVLVPELTVRLIQEDMGVSIEEAREILKESATVGDILQEELDEVVVRPPKEEGDSIIE